MGSCGGFDGPREWGLDGAGQEQEGTEGTERGEMGSWFSKSGSGSLARRRSASRWLKANRTVAWGNALGEGVAQYPRWLKANHTEMRRIGPVAKPRGAKRTPRFSNPGLTWGKLRDYREGTHQNRTPIGAPTLPLNGSPCRRRSACAERARKACRRLRLGVKRANLCRARYRTTSDTRDLSRSLAWARDTDHPSFGGGRASPWSTGPPRARTRGGCSACRPG